MAKTARVGPTNAAHKRMRRAGLSSARLPGLTGAPHPRHRAPEYAGFGKLSTRYESPASYAHHDHRRGDRRRTDRARARHDLCAAGRAEPISCSMPCSAPPSASAPSIRATNRAPPIWRSVAALATGKPQATAVVPGPGPAQCRRRAAHRVCDECAGAGAGRPDSRPGYRPPIGPSARNR